MEIKLDFKRIAPPPFHFYVNNCEDHCNPRKIDQVILKVSLNGHKQKTYTEKA